MKFLNNADFNKNQLLNVAIQNLATAPSAPVVGQIYFNTTDSTPYVWNGTAWIDFGGDITSIIAGDGLSGGGSSREVSLSIQVDGTTLITSASGVKVKDAGITSTQLASNAITTVKITDNNVTFSKIEDIATMTVIGRVSGGTGNPEEVSIISDLNNASATNIASGTAVKSYIDTTVAGIGILQGSFDASGTSFPTASPTSKGDYWYVTVSGDVGGKMELNVGDVIIANKDAASTTTAADWIDLEVNRDQATTTVLGVVKLATQADVDAGTNTTKVVTPATLKAHLDSRVGGHAADLGDTTNSSFNVTHTLGTIDVIILVKEKATGETVMADTSTVDINTVNVTFSVAPSSNEYRVIIKK